MRIYIIDKSKGVMIVNLTCRRCGDFKRNQEGHFCNECDSKNRRDIRIIQDYLMEHPKSSVADVSLDTGIKMKVINVLLLENLVELEPSKE